MKMKTRQEFFRDFFSSPGGKRTASIIKIFTEKTDSNHEIPVADEGFSDIPDSLLFYEAMKMGIDPATVEKSRLVEMVYQKLGSLRQDEDCVESEVEADNLEQ